MKRILQLIRTSPIIHKNKTNSFSTSTCNYLFTESDPKDGYGNEKSLLSPWKQIKNGWHQLKEECLLLKNELKEGLEFDVAVIHPGFIYKKWELHKLDNLDNWVTACDSDHGEGFSSCSLKINGHGYGHFSGNLDTIVPKDGIIRRAGYCSIRTLRERKSFQRAAYLNWTSYTHIVLKVRGDGRTYMVNIATSGHFDQLWHDIYHYPLYTRGGPYWQITKIPFSKFFFSHKGKIQDRQYLIDLESVTNFGITAADKVNGSFSLEIDYVGLINDPTHTEEFAYEMYETHRNIAGH